ncbi:thioredoxin family protein [Paenibacillus hamazuiensis]|uniref:thioredoxin family protein n=1 Tax=Paenibacillus hamazuiensis TaxID=2936508 RepID=UPI0020106691|nr:thioredoxin family protein [Paenibacillus hamazuiensis]
MKECSPKELSDSLQSAGSFFLFVHTPFCGTCKVTERMLDIILQMKPELAIRKCNINLAPELALRWKIASVPCIVRVERGEPIRRIYRMQSVDGLLAWLTLNDSDSKGVLPNE